MSFIQPTQAQTCQNKIAVPTLEGLGKDALEKGIYEKGFVRSVCNKVDKTSTSESGDYILEGCQRFYEPSEGSQCSGQSTQQTANGNTVTNCQPVYFVCGANGAEILKNYARVIYVWGAGMGSLVAVLIIVGSGLQITAANGDSSAIEAARNRILQSLAGLAILFLSGLILYTINPTFFVK